MNCKRIKVGAVYESKRLCRVRVVEKLRDGVWRIEPVELVQPLICHGGQLRGIPGVRYDDPEPKE